MIVMLTAQGLQTLEQIRVFLESSQPLGFEALPRDSAYDLTAQTLRQFGYARLGKADKGLLRSYLCKVTGLSRAQMTRLIAQFHHDGRIRDRRGTPARPFPRRYTREDIALLAEVDALHDTLSGPATRKLCWRAYTVFGDARFIRLAGISNGHLYNLRQSKIYSQCRGTVDKTRAVKVPHRGTPQTAPRGPSRLPARRFGPTRVTWTGSRGSTTSISSMRSPSSSSSAL